MRSSPDNPHFVTLAWWAALSVCAAYVVFFLRLSSFPLQDYPNHIARGVVAADVLFHHSARFGQQFSFQVMLAPYILGDLILAGLVEVFGPSGGAGLFTAVLLLCLPLSLLLYMRVNGLAPQAQPVVFLLALYLSTDWFFLMGFMAFRLSVAALVLSLALADLWRRRPSLGIYVSYLGALLLGYLSHLAWLVFFAAVLVVSGAVRGWCGKSAPEQRGGNSTKRQWRDMGALFAPLLLLAAWQYSVAPAQDAGGAALYQPAWGSAVLKLKGLVAEFGGFGGHLAEPLMALLALCVLWPVRNQLASRAWTRPAVLEPWAIVVTFLCIYAVLPRETPLTAYIDVRALAIVTLFVIIAVLRMLPEGSRGNEFSTAPVLGLAILLALGNLTYLAFYLRPQDAWMAQYRAVVRVVPLGARVLPVYALPMSISRPYLHAASFLTIDRGIMTPYLFAADRGDPMVYFRYRHPPYRPAEGWYAAQLAGDEKSWHGKIPPPDWQRVGCQYDYLLVTRPYDPGLIRATTRLVAMNSSAALLQVAPDSRDCRE